MALVCMTCMEMFGSGHRIGMDVPIRTVVRGVIRARAVWFVVVAGATARATSGRRSATATARRAAAAVAVFAFARLFNPRCLSTHESKRPQSQNSL